MAKMSFNSNQSNFASNFPEVTQTVKPNKTTFEMMNVEDIKLDPKGEFQKIFPLDESLISKLTEVMQNKGYDNSQPLQICEVLSEKESGWFLIDGHNRLEALIRALLKQVPVYRHTFATRTEAKVYVMEDIQLLRIIWFLTK